MKTQNKIKFIAIIVIALIFSASSRLSAQSMTLDKLTVELFDIKKMDMKIAGYDMKGYTAAFKVYKKKKMVSTYRCSVIILSETISHIAVADMSSTLLPRMYYNAGEKTFTYTLEGETESNVVAAQSTKNDYDIILSGLLIWSGLKHD